MTRAPEIGEGNAPGVVTTRPMPAVRVIEPAPSVPPARRSRRGLLWIAALLACLSAAALLLGTAPGRRWWHQLTGASSPSPPLAWAPPDSSDPDPVQIEPLPLEPKAPAAPPGAASPSTPPEVRTPPSPAERPPPAPSPAPPSRTPPSPAPPSPPLPTLPPLAIPPGTLPAPWSSATAQACARCLEQLREGGNYSVVMAAAQSLLCEDKTGRETCEAAIKEAAPGLAERAARSRDCPAAWATMAAALNLGVPADRFRGVDQACPR